MNYRKKAVLLAVALLGFHLGICAQSLSLKMQNVSVKKAMTELQAKSGYSFVYIAGDVDTDRKVSVDADQLQEAIKQILQGQQVTYEIQGKNVVVRKIASQSNAVKQERKVSGTVKDANGEPIIGANVTVKGDSSIGTITDIDGRFTLDVPAGAVLQVTYIGFAPQDVEVGKRKELSVTMSEDTEMLDEVVVVGYGVQKKVNLSGSVSAINGEEIAAKPATDALSALQGEMPGVTITRGSGQPGSESAAIQIRGYSSVNDAEALVLIDGVEGNMALLNSEDIESISVLKDAASCAIYGARAAAGVVLITTKNGVAGKPKVTYNGYVSFNFPGNMPERVPAWEEQEFINQSRIPVGGPEWNAEKSSWVGNPNFDYRPLSNGRWDLFYSVDWLGEGTKNFTMQHNHSVSVSGGSEKMNYMLSANYYYKNGLLAYGPDDYKRYNLMAKLNASLNKYVDLGVNIQYSGDDQETTSYGAENILKLLYENRGRQPIYQPEGENYPSIWNGDLQENPIDIMKNGGVQTTKYESFMGKASLTIKDLIKNLRINLSASRRAGYYSQQRNKRTLYYYNYIGDVRRTTNPANELYKAKNQEYHDVLEATVNYTFDLNDRTHNFGILAGTSYENYKVDHIDGTARNMISNDFFSFNYYDTSLATNSTLHDNIETWAMMSYFGRLNYNYKEKYLFEANVRYDGSSRLAPSKRWKAFPSVSAAWRMSEEQWFNVDWISSLKLRASWGQLGNGAVLGLYDYIPLIVYSHGDDPATYMGEKWFYQQSMASTDKTWETVETTNLGVDFGFFNNRLTGSFEYYWKFNNDMLASLQLPSQIGISVPNMNVGKLKTWGWDFNISWQDQIKDFTYQIGFNISDSKNKLLRYDGASVVGEGVVRLLEGYPINTIWGYETDGFWSSREEYLQYKADHPGYVSFNDGIVSGGDVKYVAQGEADHTIGVGGGKPGDSGDLVLLGNTTPRYIYGINLAAQWKGFDLSVMFQGVGKRDLVLNDRMFPLWGDTDMPWTIHRDYWREDNQDAYWPRLLQKSGIMNSKPSDRWIQDASYLRLKNVTLGYTIPVARKYIQKLRVYITGQDLFEISDMLEVLDPEVENQAAKGVYPFFRSWTFGVNVTF